MIPVALGGIPLTAGFVGKFYLFAVGVNAALWVPVAVLVGTSVIGLYYYLRVILTLYTPATGTIRSLFPLPVTRIVSPGGRKSPTRRDSISLKRTPVP